MKASLVFTHCKLNLCIHTYTVNPSCLYTVKPKLFKHCKTNRFVLCKIPFNQILEISIPKRFFSRLCHKTCSPSTVLPGRGIQVCEVFCLYRGKADRPEGGVRLGSRHKGTLLLRPESCPAKYSLSG